MKKKNYIWVFICLFTLYACEEGGVLFETDISDENVNLISPGDGVQVPAATIRFDWQSLEDAEQYEIQIAKPDFQNTVQLIVNEIIDSITQYEFELPVDSYEWRVKAINSGYETEYTTSKFEVVPIQNFSDNTVRLIAPADNSITNIATQTLEWEAVTGATLYRTQILEGSTAISEETTTSTSLNTTFNEGEFTWQVRAENGSENTLYSSRNILIDLTAPNTPDLSLPGDNTVLLDNNVSFEWTRKLVAGSTESDSIYVYRDASLSDLVVKDVATSPYELSLDNDTYYWRVQAFDEAGNEGNSSKTRTFEVNN